MYMNASPFGILKIRKFCCFWLISFSLQKEVSAFWVFCGPRNSWANRTKFWHACATLCAPTVQFLRVFICLLTKYLPFVCQGLFWHFLPFSFKTEPSLLREFCKQTLFYPKFTLYNTGHLKICNAGIEWLEFCLDGQQNRRKSPIIDVDNILPFYLLFIWCYNSQTLLWKVSIGPLDTNFVPCKKNLLLKNHLKNNFNKGTENCTVTYRKNLACHCYTDSAKKQGTAVVQAALNLYFTSWRSTVVVQAATVLILCLTLNQSLYLSTALICSS